MTALLAGVMALFLGIAYFWGYREGIEAEKRMQKLRDNIKR